MPVLIDTAVVPARERLDFWSEASCGIYHPLQIRSGARDEFFARMSGHELGPVGIFRIVAAPNTMIRTLRAIAAGDPERLHLCVVLRGRLNAAQGGRTGIARAGEMISYETSHPAIIRADQPFETLVVRVPRTELGGQVAQIGRRTATTLSGRWLASAAATARFVTRLADGLESGTVSLDDASVDRVLELIRALYAESGDAHQPHRPRSRAEILLNIESFIEANLDDPSLDPVEIARASFISTRYLHKLFEAEGTSVCRWVRAARLERCRKDLCDPAFDHWTILAIATRWGLPRPQHFSRLFRDAYGCSPREYRRDACQSRVGIAAVARAPLGRRSGVCGEAVPPRDVAASLV